MRLEHILGAEGPLQPIVAKTRELHTLDGLVAGFLSADLAQQTRVANLKEAELVLFSANPAAAAKLRLLAPALGRFLSDQRWQVSSVSVRVQPTASRPRAAQKGADFSAATLDSLRQLHEEMRPSAARAALARLLERRGVMPSARAPRRRTEEAEKPRRKPRI